MSSGGKGGATSSYGNNVMNNSATGMLDMFKMLQHAQNSIAQGQAHTYSPATGSAQGYSAVTQADPAAIHSIMGQYQNPYESDVISRTTDGMHRQLQELQERNAAAASAAGAFGGSRHGLVEAASVRCCKSCS